MLPPQTLSGSPQVLSGRVIPRSAAFLLHAIDIPGIRQKEQPLLGHVGCTATPRGAPQSYLQRSSKSLPLTFCGAEEVTGHVQCQCDQGGAAGLGTAVKAASMWKI